MLLTKRPIVRKLSQLFFSRASFLLVLLFFISPVFAQQTDTSSSWILLKEINKKIEQQDYDEVITKLIPYLKTPPVYNSYSSIMLHFEYGRVLKLNGDYQEALETLLLLESKLSSTNSYSKFIQPDLYHELGGIYLLLRDVTNSSYYSNKSIDERIKIAGDKAPSLFKTYTNMGTVYQAIGQLDNAIEYYNLALKIKLAMKSEPDMQLAMIYQNIGRLFYNQELFDSALFYYIESQKINEEILTDEDYQLGVFYSNFGVLQKNIGNYEDALESYKHAENIFMNIFGSNDLRLYGIYSNIGNIYRILGDYSHALQYYRNSLSLTENDGDAKYEKQFSIYVNMAGMYINNGYYEDAIEYLELCLDLKEKYLSDFDLDIPYGNLAVCYSNIGNPTKALEYFKKQVEQAENSGFENAELANAYLSYGNYCLGINKTKEAYAKISRANQIFKKVYGYKHPYVAQSSMSLADYYFQANVTKSLKLLQEALIQIVPGFNSKDINNNPDLINSSSDLLLLNILQKKANALYYSAKGSTIKLLELSLSTLDLANILSQKIQVGYMSEESKLVVSSNQKKYSVLSAQIAIQLFELTSNQDYLSKAFSIAEKSKATILLSSLQDFDAKSISNIPSEISDQEKEISKQLSIYQELIYKENENEEPDIKMIANWQKKVFNLSQQQEDIINNYKDKYPSYFKIKYETATIGIENLQKQLNNSESLIEYVIGDSIIIALMISKNSITGKIININEDFFNHIELIRNNLISGEFGNKAYDNYIDYVNSANIIYQDILDGFLSNNEFTNLIIIPDDVLFYIPFEVLLSSKPEKLNLDYRKLDYLIREYNIRYSYSATLGFTDFKRNRKTSNKLLAMAPEYGDYSGLNAERQANIKDYKNYLINLPGVVDEINQVVKKVRGNAFSGSDATESLFKKIASNYGVLHLAMHTIVNDNNPMFSKLVFYLNNDSLEDGMLNTYELYNMNINANLTVLSACNTGFGALQKGEGVMSLARGFISAGCPNIIMTLWALEDKSGLTIMTSFYNLFSKHKSSDYALWQAKLSYLEGADKLKAHPYFWSGYVMIGSPVKLKSSILYYIIGSLLMLLSIGFIIRAKKKAS